MIYNGKEIQKLGFGFMRLPQLDGQIDMEQTKKMVDIFMENGFTYFDTAFGYHNQKSEGALKTALVDRYPRDSFQITSKLPAWKATSEEEAKQMFFTSLERAGVDYFDFFLLHNMGGHRTKVFDDFGIWDFLNEQKALGKIKKLGFSMHDGAAHLEEILTKHPEVDFVQLQINYIDWNDSITQSRLCYETARKHDKPVIIMEPIRGGFLANPPQNIAEIFTTFSKKTSFAEWALRFAGSLDGVVAVLSGMSNIEQIEENVKFMKDMKPLSTEEYAVVENVQEMLAKIDSIPCTNCGYCVKECPMGVTIPNIFTAMNKNLVYGDLGGAKGMYSFQSSMPHCAPASACIACGNCEAVCPQKINIIDELVKCKEALEE
ncbi:MAG: aldo/keto reductase [Clostridia bacterium]